MVYIIIIPISKNDRFWGSTIALKGSHDRLFNISTRQNFPIPERIPDFYENLSFHPKTNDRSVKTLG